jgi:hypothetical protein
MQKTSIRFFLVVGDLCEAFIELCCLCCAEEKKEEPMQQQIVQEQNLEVISVQPSSRSN